MKHGGFWGVREGVSPRMKLRRLYHFGVWGGALAKIPTVGSFSGVRKWERARGPGKLPTVGNFGRVGRTLTSAWRE